MAAISILRIGKSTTIVAQPAATEAFARRLGAAWPCSDLAGHPVTIYLDSRGDLVDLIGPDVTANELSAFIDYALEEH